MTGPAPAVWIDDAMDPMTSRPLRLAEDRTPASAAGSVVCKADAMNIPDVQFFVDLETAVWEALVSGDPEADRAMLSEDFLGVYPSGFSDREQHAAPLASGPTMAEYQLSDARVQQVAPDAVMLSYLAEYTVPGSEQSQAMYISSLWQQREGRWWNTFSQDPPVGS